MDVKNFETLYKRLNPAQKMAVDTIEGPVMVIAGPGTGKTTILTLRIANILKQTDTPPSGILAITYTDAGVKAMRMKLREIIGNRADEVRIHTFHNFASAIIREFSDHFVHLDRSTQLNEIESETMVRELLEKEEFRDLRPFGNPDFYIQKIIGAVSDSKREAYTPEMVRSFAMDEIKRIKSDEDSISTRGATKGKLKAEAEKQIEKCERTVVFSNLYEAYEDKKKKERKIDFDDLIGELLAALTRDELLLRMLQEKFLYILVDEHQDTNNSQNELVRKLADFFDVPNVFIVGDEKQAIYRFQGASVENFLKFQSLWKEMKVIHLEDNYRSHQSILDASFGMIENNYASGEYQNLRVKLKASGKEVSGPIEIISGEDTEATEKYLVEQLKKISSEKPEATVAIITKTNRDLERVLHLCEANGVAVSSQRSIDIFNHPAGSLFFDLIEFLYDPTKVEMFSRTLAAGLWGLSFDDSLQMIKALRAGTDAGLETLPALQTLRKEITNDGALNFIIRAAEITGYQNIISREPSFVEVWRGIVTLAESLVREAAISDPRELLKKLVAYRTAAETRSVKINIGTPDLKIQAMTAHGSKGLEFDFVFIPYATEESWVGRNWGSYFVLPHTNTTNDLRDVRRLFYVALTRARKHAVILHGGEEFGGTLMPLRFIDELAKEQIVRVTLPKTTGKSNILGGTSIPNTSVKKTIEYAKHVLQTSGLSVTALNHFLECPSSFLYQSILKLPQAPAVSAEKGNAMHSAISKVWTAKDKNALNVKKILEDTIRYFFEKSLLPSFEKKAVEKELLGDIPVIVRELLPHFSEPGTVFSETWSESEFKGVYGEESVTIPIHGKLDAIIDSGREAFVFDYKTRQAMSENEIKGNTKNSTGAYFRQLVFYKRLLQEDSRFAEKKIIPSLIFVVPDSKGHCKTVSLPVLKTDLEKIDSEIQSLITSVWSGAFMTDYCDDKKCEWCRLKKLGANSL